MHVTKACIGGAKCSDRCFIVAVHLGRLAWNATSCPVSDVFLQAVPSKTFHYEAKGGLDARMCKSVKILKKISSEGNWHTGNSVRLLIDRRPHGCCDQREVLRDREPRAI